jgi:GNAT superfamily N-acetyltransferase
MSTEAVELLSMLEAAWAPRGVEVDAYVDPAKEQMHIARIVVDKTLRRQGLGTLAMQDLVELADHFGLLMTLSPSIDFGGTSVDRLKRFYRRFGFVSNKGRQKHWEITASMYRLPSPRS